HGGQRGAVALAGQQPPGLVSHLCGHPHLKAVGTDGGKLLLDTRKYKVLVGSLQVSGHQDSKTMIITVSRIVPYPDFQRNASSAIAVAELAHLVSFGPSVLPICLPSSAVQLKNSTSCWVTGWGNSGISQSMKPSYTLKELKVPLSDLQTCNNCYRKKAHCMESSPSGSRGDPLTCKVEDFWVLAGVVSWESNCIGTNEPGVFTNISFYKSWNEKSAISHADLRPDFSGLFPVVLLPLIFPGLP
ncbi:hypothetical protein E2I00_006011, partial [Balaenoptera physalus]